MPDSVLVSVWVNYVGIYDGLPVCGRAVGIKTCSASWLGFKPGSWWFCSWYDDRTVNRWTFLQEIGLISYSHAPSTLQALSLHCLDRGQCYPLPSVNRHELELSSLLADHDYSLSLHAFHPWCASLHIHPGSSTLSLHTQRLVMSLDGFRRCFVLLACRAFWYYCDLRSAPPPARRSRECSGTLFSCELCADTVHVCMSLLESAFQNGDRS